MPLESSGHSDPQVFLDRCEYFGRRIEVLLRHARFASARRVIDQAELEMAELSEGAGVLLDDPIMKLGIDARTANSLENNDIFTVRDVLRARKEDLLNMPGVGRGAYEILMRSLSDAGYGLGFR